MEEEAVLTYKDAIELAVACASAEAVEEVFDVLHPADLAVLVSELEHSNRVRFFQLLGHARVAEILEYFEHDKLDEELDELPASVKGKVLTHLPDDHLVDFFRGVSEDRREELFPLLSEEKRKLTQRLLEFPEGTVGGRMTTSFARIRPDMTVHEAVESLRIDMERTEIFSRIFVVDERNRLLGKVRLRDLTFSEPATLISDIQDEQLISVPASMPEKEAAQTLAKYDAIALPVVNPKGALIGILTHDDALDILQEKSEEQMERFMAITADPEERSYLDTPTFNHFKRRVVWLVTLAGLGIISGEVMFANGDLLANYIILTTYIPMLAAAGGNTGSQSATLVIQAMSQGKLKTEQFFRVLWKELRVGCMLAAVLGLLAAGRVLFFSGAHETQADVTLSTVAFIVGLALSVQVITSSVVGAILPLLAKLCRIDPAVIASPAITTFVDVSGLLIYFQFAKWALGLH